jgi:hypothetical protein
MTIGWLESAFLTFLTSLLSLHVLTAASKPTAPTNLGATALSSSQIKVTWKDNSNNEQQFYMERSTNNFKSITQFILSANVTAYTDTNLAASKTYNYRVRARNSSGYSVYSNTGSATTLPSGPPLVPGNLTATPTASTQIRLSWQDTSNNEQQFRLERSTNGFLDIIELVFADNVTTCTDSNLVPGISYDYRLHACNGTGCSAYGNVVRTNTGTISTWTPLFQGIDHASGATSIGVSPIQKVQILRVDLTAPGIQVMTTPRSENYIPESSETIGLTTSHFLLTHGLQAAINGQWFAPCCSDLDGTPEEIWGMALSSNIVVSSQESNTFSTTMLFSQDNVPAIIGTNWPSIQPSGIWTAVSGKNPILYRGNYAGTNDTVAPRTAIGISEDKRYLFMLTIDGRQAGYSDGASDLDTAAWFRACGTFDAAMLDGGGSTTMAISDGMGGATLLNRPIHNNLPGTERPVGNHLGIYALLLPTATPGTVAVAAPAEASAPQGTRLNPRLPAITDFKISHAASGASLLRLRGKPDYTFTLQYNEQGNAESWGMLTTGRFDESGVFEFVDKNPEPGRTYRALVP